MVRYPSTLPMPRKCATTVYSAFSFILPQTAPCSRLLPEWYEERGPWSRNEGSMTQDKSQLQRFSRPPLRTSSAHDLRSSPPARNDMFLITLIAQECTATLSGLFPSRVLIFVAFIEECHVTASEGVHGVNFNVILQ